MTPSMTQVETVWTWPNLLTFSRVGLAVVVFALIGFRWYLPALVVFGLAALTDYFDGLLARRLGQTSALGRQLDPLVDKVLVAGGFIFLMEIPESGLRPWMVTLIIVREMLVQALRGHMEGRGVAFGSKLAGKLKTVFQFLAIITILLCLEYRPGPAGLWARDLLIWTAVGLTIYSGLEYIGVAWSRSRSMPKSTASAL